MEAAEIAHALAQTDAEQRRRGVLSMAGRNEPALGPLLLQALGDHDWRVREEAIRVGRGLAEPLGIVPDLVAALRDPGNIGLRNAALALLKLLGRAALAPLVSVLPMLDPGARRLVIEALGHGGDSEVVRMLAEAADLEDLNLATAALDALAVVGGPAAEAVLRKKLGAKSAYERIAALDALDRLQAVVPFEELAPLLADRITLRVVVRLVGRSGASEAVPALVAALADRSDAVASTAVLALADCAEDAVRVAAVRQQLASVGFGLGARLRALAQRPDAVGPAAARLLALQQGAPASHAEADASQPTQAGAAVPSSAQERSATAWTRGPRLEPDEFRAIAELIRRRSGIKLADEVRPTIERRLGERLAALRIDGFAQYRALLSDGGSADGEIERAIELITTNETYFFRDLPQLRSFEREVLPELHALAHRRRSLCVWSAGCSTGEEAYTLAILMAREQRFAGWNLRVVGNDISRRVVQAARKGVYRGASFRALPAEYEAYFFESDEGMAVDPQIRALCHFARFNLLDEGSAAMFGRVDAIFCRNVLIYFDEEARRRVISNFYERLNPGGYLMLGHSDSLLNVTTAFELAHLSGDLAYRKPLTAGRSK